VKLLELFSGQGSISATFKENGFEAYRVDWSDKVEAELHADIMKLTVEQIIDLCGGVPDVVWASPQCTTYSIATHIHRTRKNGLEPMTEMAAYDDKVNEALWELIDNLLIAGTKYYFIENPRGRMRRMHFVKGARFTLSYCSYGRKASMKGYEHQYINKPTDIWTNHPNPSFKPLCTKSTPTHIHGLWGEACKHDYLNRGEIPKDLINFIMLISQE